MMDHFNLIMYNLLVNQIVSKNTLFEFQILLLVCKENLLVSYAKKGKCLIETK